MNAIVKSRLADLERLCHEFRVKSLDLFGSAISDTLAEASDLDFLVVFEPSTPEEHAELYLGLLAALQDIFERGIDLVELNAIRNPYFREEIQRTRLILYAA